MISAETILESDLLQVAQRASCLAGDAIMQVYNSGEDMGVVSKPDDTPVTKADYASNRLICETLAPTGIPILSEESVHQPYEVRKDYPRLWVVDPLDGTKHFVRRDGDFAVCIALVENHRPTLGVVYVPSLSLLYSAENGRARRQKRSRSGLDTERVVLPLHKEARHVVATGGSQPSEKVMAFCERLRAVWPDTEVRGYGSAFKQCLVAEGSAAFYPKYGRTMEWDTAAGQVILENAGGSLLRMADGMPMTYNRKELANPQFVAVAGGVEARKALTGLLSEG